MPWNSLKRHNFSETNVISFKVGPFWQRELHFPHIFFFLLKAFLCLWSQIVSQFLCRRSLFKGPFLTQTIFSPLFCIFILWHCCTSQIIWKSKSIWCSVTFPRYFFLSVFGFFFSWIIRMNKMTWNQRKRTEFEVRRPGPCHWTSLSLSYHTEISWLKVRLV